MEHLAKKSKEKKVCVFGASMEGLPEALTRSVTDLARRLGEEGFALVFGGFGRGLMAASAEGFAQAGSDIIGVVPASLARNGRAHPACTQVIETPDLESRKRVMEETADAFLVVPGGIGTLDELFGVLAKAVVGEASKPVVLYNYGGFYDPLIRWMEELNAAGFLQKAPGQLYLVSENPEVICAYLVG